MPTHKRYIADTYRQRHLTPKRDMYALPDTRVEYQLFSSEYFSNADVKLYFGDIWVDEITNIQFQLQEDVMPIYGYHSYTFDTVARGKRIVQGSFGINFTSVGYLHEIVKNAHAIFHAIEEGENRGIISPTYYQNMKLTDILTKLGKDSFDQIADEYEQAIWGRVEDENERLSYQDRPYFRQDDIGFDIRIQYGAISESTDYLRDQYYRINNSEPPNTTVDMINGVQLMGMAKSIATSDQGAPIQEQYSFMARDLNGLSLSKYKNLATNNQE